MKGWTFMKVVLGIILLISSIVISGIYTQNYISSSSTEIVNDLYMLDRTIRSEQWAEAKKQQIKLEQDWEKVKSGWAMILNHNEIDNIDIALSQFKSYIETTQHSDALSKVSELILLFNHIPDKEKVAIKNIL